jgi:hypothetical protein
MVNLKIVDPRDPASARYGISNFLWFEGIMNYRASLSNQRFRARDTFQVGDYREVC